MRAAGHALELVTAVYSGQHNAFSVDIHPRLLDAARVQLASLGYHPRLTWLDGANGWVEHAPYDRLSPPAGSPRSPTRGSPRPGRGLILTEALAGGRGMLVRLTVTVLADPAFSFC